MLWLLGRCVVPYYKKGPLFSAQSHSSTKFLYPPVRKPGNIELVGAECSKIFWQLTVFLPAKQPECLAGAWRVGKNNFARENSGWLFPLPWEQGNSWRTCPQHTTWYIYSGEWGKSELERATVVFPRTRTYVLYTPRALTAQVLPVCEIVFLTTSIQGFFFVAWFFHTSISE